MSKVDRPKTVTNAVHFGFNVSLSKHLKFSEGFKKEEEKGMPGVGNLLTASFHTAPASFSSTENRPCRCRRRPQDWQRWADSSRSPQAQSWLLSSEGGTSQAWAGFRAQRSQRALLPACPGLRRTRYSKERNGASRSTRGGPEK